MAFLVKAQIKRDVPSACCVIHEIPHVSVV
jgi:hypothetical protein